MLPLIALGLVAVLAVPSASARAPPVQILPPFAAPATWYILDGNYGSGGVPNCHSSSVLHNGSSFDVQTGRLNFSATAKAVGTNARPGRCATSTEGLGGIIYYPAFNFTTPFAGLGIFRAYWDLGWTAITDTSSNSASRQTPYAAVQVTMELDVLDLNLSTSYTTTAAWYYGDSTNNSAQTHNGPGAISIPLVVALTHGHVYSFSIEVQEQVVAAAYSGSSAYAKLNLDGSGHTQLERITIS
jgi:hypothetical protein